MDLKETLRNLCRIDEPGGSLVTVAWDVSRGGGLPGNPAKALKRPLLAKLRGGDPENKAELNSMAEKILGTVEGGLRPETKGFFLVAGPAIWSPVELEVPIRNFIHRGRTAYLPPLLEATARYPRAAVLRYDHRQAVLEEVELGRWGPAERMTVPGVERDPEHAAPGREGAIRTGGGWMRGGMGGGGRDRYDHHFEEDAEGLLRRVAARVGALDREAPLAAVLAFGDREHFPFLRDALPEELRSRAVHVGPLPHRHEDDLRTAAGEELGRLAAEAGRRAVAEFRDRRAQGCHAAAGPAEIIPELEKGAVDRVILDAEAPVDGGKCGACGVLYPSPKTRCDSCAVKLEDRSLTQELTARAILHPPMALTFIADAERAWLRKLGGMAALLAAKGVRSKR